MLVKIWDVKELAKVQNLKVEIDNWMLEVIFYIKNKEFERIRFSQEENFKAYVDELKQHNINVKVD